MRQLTQHNNHQQPLGNQANERGAYQVAHQTTVAIPTLRQLTQHNTYQQPLKSNTQQRSRADANNSLVNVTKEKTVSNYNMGPNLNYTTVELRDPVQINRDLYPVMSGQNTSYCIPILHTRMPNQHPQWTERNTEKYQLDNLNTNPFVNNLVHKSKQ